MDVIIATSRLFLAYVNFFAEKAQTFFSLDSIAMT
jgi:hypothetical protein